MFLYLILFYRGRRITVTWPNGLASRRKSTQPFDLPPTCVSFGHPLAFTCIDFGRASNSYESRPSGQPTQVDTSWSQVNCICVKFTQKHSMHTLRLMIWVSFVQTPCTCVGMQLIWRTEQFFSQEKMSFVLSSSLAAFPWCKGSLQHNQGQAFF